MMKKIFIPILFLSFLFSQEVQDGPFKSYHSNGKVEMEGTIKNGKEDGLWKMYYESGRIEGEGTFKDGKLNGPFKSYYENGQLEMIGNYKYDLED